MDPIAPELLMALAEGTAGAAGRQLWTSLREMVGRSVARQGTEDDEGELEAFLGVRGDSAEREPRARELAAALALRAQQDQDFAHALTIWRRNAERATGSGDVSNVISGGTVHRNVIQARDISGPITF